MSEHKPIWDYRVAAYLFLAGVGAGSFAISGIYYFVLGEMMQSAVEIAAWLGLLLVACGTFLLVSDLGQPVRFWRVLFNIKSSVMSFGAWTISIFMLLCFLYILWGNTTVLGLGILFGMATAAYTGVLLGILKGRPFWNTSLLPVLFLVSAFSTGIAAVHLIAVSMGHNLNAFRFLDAGFVMVELLLLFFYLVIMKNSTVEASRSADELIKGRFSRLFWGGVITVGLFIPLVLHLLSPRISVLASVLVLIGGYILRYSILRVGNRTLLPGESFEAGWL